MPHATLRRLAASALVGAGVLLGSAALAAVLGDPTPVARAAPALQRGGASPCWCGVTKSLAPDTLRLCDTSEVTIGVTPDCPGTPVHIVFIIDEDYKPNYSNPRDRTSALHAAVMRLELDEHPNIRIGVVWMQNGAARKRLDLTNDATKIIGVLDVPPVAWWLTEPQCFECGFREAVRILDKGEKDNPDVDIDEIVVLAPLGVYYPQSAPGVLRGAATAKSRKALVISTCYAWTHCVPELRQAASEPRYYMGYGEGARLATVLFSAVRESVATFLRRVSVEDTFPDGVEVVPGSISPEPAAFDPALRTLTWTFDQPITTDYTLTYRVRPLAVGSWPMGTGGHVELQDSVFRLVDTAMPAPLITVSVECPLEPSPTPPPTPTDTPPPPTDTPPPTATPPPPTATPRPGPIFLPIAVREQCKPLRTYSDVALVLDMSTTMRERTPDGRRKVEAVVAAAADFVAGLSLAPEAAAPGDRVAIVGFNREAWIAQGLTGDAGLLGAAIRTLPERMAEHTRLDLAVARGAEALGGARAESTPVLVLLTDGLPNQVPYAEDGTMESTVLRRADAAKAAGITIYAIGVGRADGPAPEVNAALLRALASQPEQYYPAPDAGQLGRIYGELTRVIPCGGERYWSGGR